MNAPRRKAPPFANLIDPESDLVMIYCGEKAWKLARPGKMKVTGWITLDLDDENLRVASLVFPRREDPGIYRWPVKDKDVFILAMGELRTVTDPLVMELLHQGARCVSVKEGDSLTHYDPLDRA